MIPNAFVITFGFHHMRSIFSFLSSKITASSIINQMLTNFRFHSNLPSLSVGLAHLGTVPVLIASHSGQGAALAPSLIPHGRSLLLPCHSMTRPSAGQQLRSNTMHLIGYSGGPAM